MNAVNSPVAAGGLTRGRRSSTSTRDDHLAHSVAVIIRQLLADGVPHGQTDPALDAHLSAIQRLAQARRAGESVGEVWQDLCRDDPELRNLLCGDAQDDGLSGRWRRQIVGTKAIFEGPLNPPRWIVPGMIPRPGLVCVYGPPGHQKTNLLLDLSVCVATGSRWLVGGTAQAKGTFGFVTTRTPVLIVDFDMGETKLKERLRAFARGHGVEEVPDGMLRMWCPYDSFSLGDFASVEEFGELVRDTGAKLVIVDALVDVTGGVDENSAEMGRVLGHLRRVLLSLDLCVLLVTHSRKTDPRAPGSVADTLRGSSAIAAKLDLGLFVTRHDEVGTIRVIPGKCRGPGFGPFAARFDHESDPDSYELRRARFLGVPDPAGQRRAHIETAIRGVLADGRELSKRQLAAEVVKLGVGSDRTVRAVVNELIQQDALRCRMVRQSHLVSLPTPGRAYRRVQCYHITKMLCLTGTRAGRTSLRVVGIPTTCHHTEHGRVYVVGVVAPL